MAGGAHDRNCGWWAWRDDASFATWLRKQFFGKSRVKQRMLEHYIIYYIHQTKDWTDMIDRLFRMLVTTGYCSSPLCLGSWNRQGGSSSFFPGVSPVLSTDLMQYSKWCQWGLVWGLDLKTVHPCDGSFGVLGVFFWEGETSPKTSPKGPQTRPALEVWLVGPMISTSINWWNPDLFWQKIMGSHPMICCPIRLWFKNTMLWPKPQVTLKPATSAAWWARAL